LEHILLNNYSHENDKYPYEKINFWVNTLLAVDFLGKDIIVKQLMGAEYELKGEYEYLDVKFKPNSCERYPYNVRVPIEILAKQSTQNVVNILLHVIDGYVALLDINNMDLTDFNGEISLDNVEYRVDEKVKLQ
jgi:hypothetical protein